MEQRRTQVDINISILAVLSNYEWMNINQIAHKTNLNQQRLPKIIDHWEKREYVRRWEALNEQEKSREKAKQINAEGGMHQITPLGYSVFNNIRNNCLDEYAKDILRVNQS